MPDAELRLQLLSINELSKVDMVYDQPGKK